MSPAASAAGLFICAAWERTRLEFHGHVSAWRGPLMRLGLLYGFSNSHESIDIVLEAERLGYDSVWTGEAWGSDSIVPLAWIGALTRKIRLGTAIMQMPARTPAMT